MIGLSLLLPPIKNFQDVLNDACILSTSNKEHRKVFGFNSPMTGWRKPKSPQIIKVRFVVGLDAKFAC